MKSGVYVLVVEVSGVERRFGALGKLKLPPGFYLYVGSAVSKRGRLLEKRILRHLRPEKKLRWHIDYLLDQGACSSKARVKLVAYAETERRAECVVAKLLSRSLKPVPGFGCSDCKCISHLYYSSTLEEALSALREAFREAGLTLKLATPSDLLVKYQDEASLTCLSSL